MPPVYLGRRVRRGARSLVATKRRRILTAFGVVLVLATAFVLLFPGTVEQWFGGTKPEITKAKIKPNHQVRPPAPVPQREHDKKR